MPSVILNNISKPSSLTQETETKPLSFLEWTSRNVGISFSDAEVQYSKYIQSFYTKTERKNVEQVNKLKNDYLNLIRKLQIIFENDEEFERYKNIDVSSDTDLSLAIPAYARKLKEIALFYAKKRQELKNKKLEYNLVGSYDGLSKLLYSKLVSKFTRNDQTNFVSENPLITQSPEFSAIRDAFEVEIEELYNTVDHFENTEQINPFACIFNDLCHSLFATPLSAKADPLENIYLCEPSNDTVDNLLQSAYDKYLSTDIAFVSGGYYVENFKTLNIPFEQGNNFFYWFSGSTVFDIPDGIFKGIGINDITWTDAIGGSASDVSDLVFLNVGNVITQGAWLQDTEYVTVTATMSATMTDGKIFKFPYPDFGTSAVGGDWSGPGLNDTLIQSKKFFPTEEDFSNTENTINRLYWNSFSSISTVNSMYLQETTLGQNGNASNKFNNADKVYVSNSPENKQLYTGDLQVAWLYDLRQTQIPITAGENKIYYPLQRYVDDSELFFSYANDNVTSLSSLSIPDAFAGAVAALSLDDADMIIKQQTICGPEVEAAWLKSVPLKYFTNYNTGRCDCAEGQETYYTDWFYVSGGIQNSLAFRCDANRYNRFIWAGNTADINEIRGFTGFDHDDSCPYKQLSHPDSIVDKNFLNLGNKDTFEKWMKCTCQAIQHSPFGHNRPELEAFSITPDFIVKDTGYPNAFNKKTWIGSDGKDYRSSKDSAKFYPVMPEKDVGWGKGEWRTQTGEPFVLEKGQSYIYYRADTNNCSFESPYFIINQKYDAGVVSDENCNRVSHYPQWFKAVQDENGNWIDAGVVSDMNIHFGDFLNYVHRPVVKETRTKFLYDGNAVNTVSGDFVVFSEPDDKISFIEFTSEYASVNFLIKIPVSGNNRFWGNASYGSDIGNKRTAIDNNEFRTEFDYLQITQPIPSNVILNDKNVVEYKFGNCSEECFLWTQNLTFQVYAPVRKWNRIVFDECVQSEILTYLNNESTNCYQRVRYCLSDCDSIRTCGCEHFCNPSKTGLTATHVDSDIIFNTEINGIPVFVNYFARTAFNQSVTLHDITDGEKSVLVPIVSGDYINPSHPWRNLLNQKGSDFVVKENTLNLQTKEDLSFYDPKRIGMARYETFDARTTFMANNTGLDIFRKDNYFGAPFAKARTASHYVTENSLGKKQGDVDAVRAQTFTPYTNTHEKTDKEYYGLYELPLNFSPWNKSTGKWNESDIYVNFRNQPKVKSPDNWFTDQLVLTGDVSNWETDVYGNQYFVVHDTPLTFTESPSSYGQIFVKNQNGKVDTIQNAMSSIIDLYTDIQFTTIDTFSAI